ncbi:ParB/RepB/Spo0J family partition protein [bacterium]|nr:ParB/RepB/Spo0J family partition protein [bacterium]
MKNKKSSGTGVQHVVTLDPKTVHPPAVSSRHASAFIGSEFEELKQSMQSAGKNVQPILVRPRLNVPGHYDLIFGERRHRASLESPESVELRAIVDDSLDDIEAFFSAVHENGGRKSLSPLELGQQILYGIERKIFKNQGDASRQLNINKSLVSLSVALASLPPEVISAFRSTDKLQHRYAKDLTDAVRIAPELVKLAAIKIRDGGEILTPIEVKLRLLRAADKSVAPLNKKTTVSVEFGGHQVAKVAFDKAGYAQFKLDFSLDAAQEVALAALLKRFYKQSLSRSVVAESKSNALTLKRTAKLADKLKSQIAAAKRDIKKEALRVKRNAAAKN